MPITAKTTWIRFVRSLLLAITLVTSLVHTVPISAQSGECEGRLTQGPVLGNGVLNAIAWSPDGSTLAAATSLGVDFIDARTLSLRDERLNAPAPINMVAWSPDGHQLAAAGNDDVVRLWTTGEADYRAELQPPDSGALTWLYGNVRAFAPPVIPDEERVFRTQLAFPSLGEVPISMPLEVSEMWWVEWSPTGDTLASVSSNGDIRLWDAASGASLQQWQNMVEGKRRSLITWSPDGETLASPSRSGIMRWDVASGRPIPNSESAEVGFDRRNLQSAEWSPDGEVIAAASGENIYVWDTQSENYSQTWRSPSSDLELLEWSPDGQRLASTGRDGFTQIWSKAGELLTTLQLANRQYPVWSLSWSPDGRLLAGSSQAGWLYIWDVATGSIVAATQLYTPLIGALRWSPDQQLIASSHYDGAVRIWDVAAGTLVRALQVSDWSGYVEPMEWSPDSTQLFTHYAKQLQLWDPNTGVAEELAPPISPVNAAAWRPSGSLIALNGTFAGAYVSDAATGQMVIWMSGLGPGEAITWSPDGRNLFQSTLAGRVLWDMVALEQLSVTERRNTVTIDVIWPADRAQPLEALITSAFQIWIADGEHEQLLAHMPILLTGIGGQSIAWSPDAQLLAVGYGNQLYLLSATTGQFLDAVQGSNQSIKSIDWSSDGNWIAVAGDDGAIHLWQCTS